MKALYGITNHNIHTIADYIKEFKESLPEDRKAKLVTQILGFEDEDIKSDVLVLLVPSVALFTKNMSAINRTRAVVFVFDAAVLCEYLTPIQLLDVQTKTASYLYTFRPIDYDYLVSSLRLGLTSPGNSVRVATNTVKVIPAMLDQIKGRSLMQPILTYLYKIPDTDQRYKHQAVILKWIVVTDSGILELKKQLYALNKDQQHISDLLNCMKTVSGTECRQAVQEVLELRKTGKPVSYDKLAKKYPNIDIFDVRYILRTYRRIQSFQSVDVELKQIFLQRKMKNENENHKVH